MLTPLRLITGVQLLGCVQDQRESQWDGAELNCRRSCVSDSAGYASQIHKQ